MSERAREDVAFAPKPFAAMGTRFDRWHPYHAGQDSQGHLRDFGDRVLQAHARDVQDAAEHINAARRGRARRL